MALPMLWALLNIWANAYQHRHSHVMVGVIGYWLVCSFLGTSTMIIMALLLPVMLILGMGLVLTFIVTWKTGRLQEIRSGIAAIGLSLMLLSQVLRAVVELTMFVDLIITVSLLVITIALVNPWKQKEEIIVDLPYQTSIGSSPLG